MPDTTSLTEYRPGRAELRAAIVEFLGRAWVGSGAAGELPAVGDDDNIFDMGLVDSLSLAEMLVVVEELSGRELDFISAEPEVFFTLRGMLDYVEGAPPNG
jgi:hypothetical protein